MKRTKLTFAAIAAFVSFILAAPDAKGGSINWAWRDATMYGGNYKTLNDVFKGEGNPLIRDNSYVFLLLGHPGLPGNIMPDLYIGDGLKNDLDSRTFDPENYTVLAKYKPTDILVGIYNIVTDGILTPGDLIGYTVLVISVNGIFGTDDVVYDYAYFGGVTMVSSGIPGSAAYPNANETKTWLITVPEPATGLLALAGLGLLMRRRRR